MKYAGPVRAQLGVRSVFNILGPLANPAMTNYIVLGVYEKRAGSSDGRCYEESWS